MTLDGGSFFGKRTRVFGIFAALSRDGGKSRPVKKLLTNGADRKENGDAWIGTFELDENHAESRGRLAAAQAPDGVVHLISSGLYCRFNPAWLES